MQRHIQAIIMAGGEGTRLRPITCTIPKPLVSICGRPCAEYIIDLLERHNFTSATMTVSYLASMLEEHFSDSRLDISFVHEHEPLGTAGCVRNAWDGVSDVLVISGDAVCDFNLTEFISFFENSKGRGAIAVKKVNDPREYGLCDIDKKGRITAFVEKPSYENCCAEYANTGVYILSADLVKSIPQGVKSDFAKDIFPKALKDGIYAYEEQGYWCDIGDIRSLIKCQQDIAQGKAGLEPQAHRDISGILYKKQTVFRGAAIRQPAYIGADVSISPGAIIEGGSIIEDNVCIGEGAKIHGSIIGKGAVIGAKVQLVGAVVCRGAVIDRHTRCFEQSVVGDGCKVGESCTIESGVKVWPQKQIEKNTELLYDVKYGYGRRCSVDDDGCIGAEHTELTSFQAALYGEAVGSSVGKGEAVAVGFSVPNALSDAFCCGVVSTGANVWKIGECCEAQLRKCADMLKSTISCFLSYGAATKIKVREKGGLNITRDRERAIEGAINRRDIRYVSPGDFGRVLDAGDLKEIYTACLCSLLPEKLDGVNTEFKTSSKKIGEIMDSIFHSRNDIRGNKITFHFTNDTSRVSAYTEQTGYVFHERLVLLGMKISLELGRTDTCAVEFTFPSAAERLCEGYHTSVFRYYNTPCTKSDEAARVQAMREENMFVRDGIELACLITGYLSRTKKTLSQALSDLPDFTTGQRFICISEPVAEAIKKLKGSYAAAEGVVYHSDDGRAVVRPVKSGKGLMLFVEATKSETAQSICDDIERKLKS